MISTAQITIPEDLKQALETDAKAMGLDLVAYLHFLRACANREHDQNFRDAARFAFSKYPETLKRLAQ